MQRPVPRPVALHADVLGIPGLHLLTAWISEEEEGQLLQQVG